MKKIILLLVLTLLPMVASADESGKCGENVTWTFDESTGTLYISGTGNIPDYYSYEDIKTPWDSFKMSILKINIYNGITRIGVNAFDGCTNVSSITIPNTVTEICMNSFRACQELTTLTLPYGIKKIDKWAFAYCINIKSLLIPSSVIEIGDDAFLNCRELETVIVDNENKYYDSRNNCNAIIETLTNTLIVGGKTTIIPDGVEIIYKNAFSTCYGLKSLNIPNTVKIIGENAFYGCIGLTSITIPEGVKTIEKNTFSSCENISYVFIPSSITYIDYFSFYRCKKLSSFICLAKNTPKVYPTAFESTDISKATLYVPDAVVDDYKATSPWSQFGAIKGFNEPSGIEIIMRGKSNNAQIFTLDGKRVETPKKGLNIIRMSDGSTKKVVIK